LGPFSFKFLAENNGEPQHIGGGIILLNLAIACNYTHLAKIQEMKSISKPRLPFEIYDFQEIMSTDDFRKKSMGTSGFGEVDSYGA